VANIGKKLRRLRKFWKLRRRSEVPRAQRFGIELFGCCAGEAVLDLAVGWLKRKVHAEPFPHHVS